MLCLTTESRYIYPFWNSEDTEEPKKKKLFEKKNKKDKKDEQIADLTDKLTRHMAEFDNYRKRTEKEKSAMYEIGAKDVVEKILPIVDNFERGLQYLRNSSLYQQLLPLLLRFLPRLPVPALWLLPPQLSLLLPQG